MAKRDVDSVDPAVPEAKQVPERIELAERWREAGKVLANRSPEVFAEFVALFEAWTVAAAEREEISIDETYPVC